MYADDSGNLTMRKFSCSFAMLSNLRKVSPKFVKFKEMKYIFKSINFKKDNLNKHYNFKKKKKKKCKSQTTTTVIIVTSFNTTFATQIMILSKEMVPKIYLVLMGRGIL